MKKILLALLSLTAASFAFAGNDGTKDKAAEKCGEKCAKECCSKDAKGCAGNDKICAHKKDAKTVESSDKK